MLVDHTIIECTPALSDNIMISCNVDEPLHNVGLGIGHCLNNDWLKALANDFLEVFVA